jgi:uncharacterized membrane protein YdjX (TVP38/TMEM64 family)
MSYSFAFCSVLGSLITFFFGVLVGWNWSKEDRDALKRVRRILKENGFDT